MNEKQYENHPVIEPKAPKKHPRVLFILALVLCLSLIFSLIGHFSVAAVRQNGLMSWINTLGKDDDTEFEVEKLKYIYNILKEDYYKDLSDAEIIRAMYSGMLDKMDSQFTFYLTPEENKEISDSMKGEYSGIGAQVAKQNEQYLITDLFDGSPALEAGLRIGDVFVKIGDQEVADFADVSSLAAAVRGEEGTTVKIVVFRPSENKEMEFEVKRGKITNSNLHYEMLEDGIGYIRIGEFNSGVSDNFIAAIKDLQKQGVKTLIFDLRNNGGGYVHEVVRMLSYLLPKGELAVAKGRMDGKPFEEPWMSEGPAQVPDNWKYQILINKYSASASELFSGCLRDYDKATLIGEKSFGKGVGTITKELVDGSAIQITNFHYYLPKGQCVQGEGLEPQVKVSLPEDKQGLPLGQLTREEDTQLQKAIELAKEVIK